MWDQKYILTPRNVQRPLMIVIAYPMLGFLFLLANILVRKDSHLKFSKQLSFPIQSKATSGKPIVIIFNI